MLNFEIISRYKIIARRGLFILLLLIIGLNAFSQAPNINYATPQVYTVNTAIAPLTPINIGGAVPAGAYGQVSTVAGNGLQAPINGPALSASFTFPLGTARDRSGNIYIVEEFDNKIRVLNSSGVVTDFAGINTAGFVNGTTTNASFSSPNAIAIDNADNIYVADAGNYAIRKITPAGIVITLAGNGTRGFTNGTGTSATFGDIYGIIVDNAGDVFVADASNYAIRKITPTGVVTTFAGSGTQGSTNLTGTAASFQGPRSVAIDNVSNIFVADGSTVRKITSVGLVSTLAVLVSGSSNGPGNVATFNDLYGITVDDNNNVYVADNGSGLIRKIDANGIVTTLAGSTINGYADGIGTSAKFHDPYSVSVDNTAGILYVSDNPRIRKISLSGYTIDKALPIGLTFDPTTGVISGTPTTASPSTNYTITAYNSAGSSQAVVNITVNAVTATPVVSPPVISYVTPQVYPINTAITPLSPTNTGGAVPATIYGQVSTVAGNGSQGFVNASALSSSFFSPTRLAQDAAGNLYIADRDNRAVRKITTAGIVSTLATGFNQLNGITVDDITGNIFVTDAGSNTVKQITPAGIVSTFAAGFDFPYSVIADGSGGFYVADTNNNLIRKVSSGGVVTTFAGNGLATFADGPATSASFNAPSNIAIDPAGNVYVADAGNYKIRKITSAGVVSTVAGTGVPGNANGLSASASFNTPAGVTTDAAGNIYVADITNNIIRKIDAANNVTTLAGSGQASAINAIGLNATFKQPNDVQYNSAGFLYVTDYGNNLIRKVITTGYTIDKGLPPGLSFDPTTGIISGTPTIPIIATDYTVTAYNAGGSSSTIVNIQVVFATLPQAVITFPQLPTGTGNTITPNATSTSNEAPITYTSSNTSVAIITQAGLIQLVGPGTTIITASQAGSAHFSQATPKSQQMDVTENQFITFPAIANKTTCNADFSAGATSSNNVIPLTYASSNTTVATISATGVIHIMSAGTTTITISQAGNVLFNPATPQSQTLTVTSPVNPVVAIAPDKTSICVGATVTFTANITGVNSSDILLYQWQLNGANTSTTPTYSSSTLTPTDVIKCIVTNVSSCSATGTSNSYTGLIVNPVITPGITIATTTTFPVCSGTSITFNATATNSGINPTYQWEVNGVIRGTNSQQFTYNAFNNGDNVTCLLINNSSPCLVSPVAQSNTLGVSFIAPQNPAPSITISASTNNVYPNVPITFTAISSNAGIGLSYQWQVNGINAGTDNTVFTSTTLNNNDKVTCILLINHGCIPAVTSNELDVTILAPPTVTVKNTFTPNGDGVNDLWVIPDLNFYPNCLVTLFTRTGTQVFQSRGYSKPWDGTNNGGKLPAGVYYYVISLGNKTPNLSGWVALVR